MKREVRFVFAWLFLTCLPFTTANAASVPVFSFTGGIVGSGPLVDNVTIGYGFNINRSDIWVTDIGWFDYLGDGLAADHAVKLWDSSMTEILSVIISAGTGTLEDGFRYMALSSPIYLAPGDYVIGGTANSTLDPYIGKATSSSNWSGITYLDPRVNYTDPLAFPTVINASDADGYFGPNLKVVPIPMSVWLFGSGLLGLVGIARMKRVA